MTELIKNENYYKTKIKRKFERGELSTDSGRYIFLHLRFQRKLHVDYLTVSFYSNENRTPSQSD